MDNSAFQERVFVTICADYVEAFSVPELVVPRFVLVDNMADAYIALRPDVLEEGSTTASQINHYNGLTVLPKDVAGEFTVLIRIGAIAENYRNRRLDWIGTIAHELTHVQDFAEYAKIVDSADYNEIQQINMHGMFLLWSEINARSKGYYFTRKYTVGEEDLRNNDLLPNILNRELPWQQNYMFRQYSHASSWYYQAYYVAQYIGRLYTLQRLYPSQFDVDWIKNHFNLDPWMAEWFFFFKKYPVLAEASIHFEEMKDILRENFHEI